MKDFQLGLKEESYDLVKDISSQGPKLSWPQFLHLSPKMQQQWSKMVSTQTPKVMGSIEAERESDVLPILEAVKIVLRKPSGGTLRRNWATECRLGRHQLTRLTLHLGLVFA